MDYKISYIVCTRNRLSYLKILEENIFSRLKDDEELIIVDANSSDGSKDFLHELSEKGIVDQFISEPDVNQAHGWNKALLMARGLVIKKIIDDDVFDLTSIRKCADWMLQNPGIDYLISNSLEVSLNNPDQITVASRLEAYQKWNGGLVKSFSFSDVYLLIRRSSLAQFGLFDTQFRMLDWEYSLRCTYLGAKIAYYTGCLSLAVNTPGNITSTTSKKVLTREGKIGMLKYEYAGDQSQISLYSKFKIFVGKTLDKISKKKALPAPEIISHNSNDLLSSYRALYRNLKEFNFNSNFKIIS